VFHCQFLLVLFFVNFLMPWTRLAAVSHNLDAWPPRCVYSRVMSAAAARRPLEILITPVVIPTPLDPGRDTVVTSGR